MDQDHVEITAAPELQDGAGAPDDGAHLDPGLVVKRIEQGPEQTGIVDRRGGAQQQRALIV